MTIYEVRQNIFRGSAPTRFEDYERLANLGVKYILNLESGNRVLQDGDVQLEFNRASSLGMCIFNFPLEPFTPPSKQDLAYAIDFINSRQPVFVHCKSGVDRTGMVIAYYRMRIQRWPRAEAIKEMKAMGMHWWFKFWWPWFL